jgi:hypothetical protein
MELIQHFFDFFVHLDRLVEQALCHQRLPEAQVPLRFPVRVDAQGL